MNVIRFVDLFSGIGGFRSAAAASSINDTMFQAVAACDNDHLCKRFYQEAYRTDANEIFIDDVRSIYTGRRSEVGSTKLPPFDLLFGGFPCQPFANIGQRGGLSDPRGLLFFEILKVLSEYRPAFFVLENVQKMRNLDKGVVLNEISDRLAEIGYHVTVWDLCASDFGLPQQRRRLFFCGASDRVFPSSERVDPPTSLPLHKALYPTTWHLLEKKMHLEHLVPQKTRETVLRPNPKWMGDLEIDRAIARPITASMAKWHRANQDNYYSSTYVLSSTAVRRNITDVYSSNEAVRRLSPLEAFRLQGFPDDMEAVRKKLGIAFTPTYRLIGNAVPVPMVRAVIEAFIGAYLSSRGKAEEAA